MRNQIQKALQLCAQGRGNEAVKVFDEVSQIETDDIDLIVQRGRLALRISENIYALDAFSRAVELQPENAYYLYLLASAHAVTGSLDLAAELCRKVVEIDPDHHEPYLILGKHASAGANYSGAAKFYGKAIQLNPDGQAPYPDMIISLRNIGKHEDALKYAKELLNLEPSALNHIPISRVLAELGETDEAVSYLEKAIEIDETCGSAYHELSIIKKFSAEDGELIAKAEKVLHMSVPVDERSRIHFGLGKAYNDCKQWDEAFEHYKQGNLLDRVAVEPTGLSDCYKVAKSAYNESFIRKSELYGSDSSVPVFIVGMPRSGTTLTEQIIASHPDAGGAGELSGISQIHADIFSTERKATGGLENSLSKNELAEHAESYLKILCDTRENVGRVVDKQPSNFTYMGLMYKLFPNARFVHVMRHPLDTCLSCYFQRFAYLSESYDLEWLGKRYRLYSEAMDHWKKLLPEEVVLEVHYEQLVQDIETQSRRIIDFCDLPWDDQCLEFYKTSRPIATASVWQARQPVYTSSAKRWVNYARHLAPLVNQVSDYLDEEDIAELEKHGVKVRKKWGLGFLKRAGN